LRRGSIFICLTHRLEVECSNWRSREYQTPCPNKTSSIWVQLLTFILVLTSKQYRKKPYSCLSENAKMQPGSNRLLMDFSLLALQVILKDKQWTCMIFQQVNWKNQMSA
jgi:hypothetical protein